MAQTGPDIKRNIVQLIQLKGLKQSGLISGGIATTTVKSVFQTKSSETPDLDTVNKFAAVLDVQTHVICMTSQPEEPGMFEKRVKRVKKSDGEYIYEHNRHNI